MVHILLSCCTNRASSSSMMLLNIMLSFFLPVTSVLYTLGPLGCCSVMSRFICHKTRRYGVMLFAEITSTFKIELNLKLPQSTVNCCIHPINLYKVVKCFFFKKKKKNLKNNIKQTSKRICINPFFLQRTAVGRDFSCIINSRSRWHIMLMIFNNQRLFNITQWMFMME